MIISGRYLIVFGFTCIEFSSLLTWFAIGKGFYESIPFLLFFPPLLLLMAHVCSELTKLKSSK